MVVCALKTRFLGQKGRKIYVEAQNARETSQKAEFEGEKPSCGVKNEKGGEMWQRRAVLARFFARKR